MSGSLGSASLRGRHQDPVGSQRSSSRSRLAEQGAAPPVGPAEIAGSAGSALMKASSQQSPRPSEDGEPAAASASVPDKQIDALDQKEQQAQRSAMNHGADVDVRLQALVAELERKLRGELNVLGEQMQKQVQDIVNQDRQDREALHASMHSRVAEVEQVSFGCRDSVQALRGLVEQQIQDFRTNITAGGVLRQDSQMTFNGSGGGSQELQVQLLAMQELREAFRDEKHQLHSTFDDLQEKLKSFQEFRDDNARFRTAIEDLIMRQDKELRGTFNNEKLQVQGSLDELQRKLSSFQELRETFNDEKHQVQAYMDDVQEKLVGGQGVHDEQGSPLMAIQRKQEKPDALGSASTQPALDGFDRRLQKEVKDRMQEAQRLWSAIENHTHDLDVSSLRLDTSMLVMEEPSPQVDSAQASSAAPSTLSALATSTAPILEPAQPAPQAPWQQAAPAAARGLAPFHTGGKAEGPPMNP